MHPSRLRLALAAALASEFACPPANAQAEAQTVEPTLRMSRELARPLPPPDAASGRRTLALDGPDQGPLFLRADRLQGTKTRVEAEGAVELRSRRETVLADFLSYDFDTQEIRGRGNVLLRQGNDFVTGPELTFKRDSETGVFESPRFRVGEVGARGDADRITFLGSELYQVLRGRVTTCVAPREDWFLRAETMEIDTAKKVGVAHDARLDFMGLPLLYSPWLEFPLSNDRKSGFLTPTIGSSGVRGFDVAIPYYWNLAPNYDATITPRVMTKRGLQVGAQFRYLFAEPMPLQGEATLEILPEDRQTDETRWLF